jgi:hypothetical protein
MDHYIDRATGEVWGYEEGTGAQHIQPGLEPIGDVELAEIRAAQEAARAPTAQQIEAAATLLLDARQVQANSQIAAIQGRIDAINDAIEFDEALPEEVSELEKRKAQLTTWKKYRIELGRMKASVGWYDDPAWPVTPDAFISLPAPSVAAA